MYSLSPSLIHVRHGIRPILRLLIACLQDASHITTPTPSVRKADNSKGPEFAQSVGRVVAPNINVKPVKTKAIPAPTSGASKPTAEAAKTAAPSKSTAKPEAKQSTTAPAAAKKTGKPDFFGAGAKKKETPVVKKEDETEDPKKPAKMFFGGGASTTKAKETEAKKESSVKKEQVDQPLCQKPVVSGSLPASKQFLLMLPRKHSSANLLQLISSPTPRASPLRKLERQKNRARVFRPERLLLHPRSPPPPLLVRGGQAQWACRMTRVEHPQRRKSVKK